MDIPRAILPPAHHNLQPGPEKINAPFATSLASAPWLQTVASQRLLKAFSSNGYPIRFVGGCVRDGLLGHLDPTGDLDLATPAHPDQVVALLKTTGVKVIPTGLTHGTVTVICHDQVFEITTLREDVACDGRHATVQFTDDFALDAARRDFTINAMSVDQEGRLFDYFGGRDDLAKGHLRFVGEAGDRVREDYLRILRFFRFFAGYGELPADAEALSACREGARGIKNLSGERIRVEMLKLLGAENPIKALDLMLETGVIGEVLTAEPKLNILNQLFNYTPKPDPIFRLAALLRTLSEPKKAALAIVERWHLSNALANRLLMLTSEPSINVSSTTKKARRDLYRLGAKDYLDLFYLSVAKSGSKAENLANIEGLVASWTSPVFPVRGRDLIDLGLAPGPAIGVLLSKLEQWWIERDMQPDREACLLELKQRLSKNPG